ncbi:MAG: hypothetical protein HC900_00945 [Methylacidiphilales bacterium]|nr:hypothetical protein [Candidatus Methylacidiphilales bacterium]
MRAVLVALFLAFGVSACVTTVNHNTASGRPEVTIKAPADAVKSVIVGVSMNLGYTMKSDSQFQVILERDPNNILANVLLGSQYDSRVVARMSVAFMQSNQTTRAVLDLNMVTNPGSAFERLTPMTNSQDAGKFQVVLNDIRAGLESGKPPAQVTEEVTAAIKARKAAEAKS